MSDNREEFRQLLFNSEQMTPALRASYDEALNNMSNQKLTIRSALIGILLVIMLVGFTAGILRNMFVYQPGALTLVAWGVLAAALSWVSYLILRDLWQRKHTRKAQYSISQILTLAAGSITVVSLLLGLNKASDPASTFNAFYVFVFYFACGLWSLDNRIGAAELAAKEQMLRIECRLADLAEQLQKNT